MNDNINCSLAEGFSLWEKIYAQFSFIATGVIGTAGILLVDWRWVLPYLLIYVYGILGIVMRHLTCPRCPHLHVYNDCLQFPSKISRWLVKEKKTSPFSTTEKLLFYLIFILIPTYPIYWLTSNRILLIAFLLMVGMWYSGQFLYFCKRCRVYDCPFNRIALTH
jgi:MFS family permease